MKNIYNQIKNQQSTFSKSWKRISEIIPCYVILAAVIWRQDMQL